MEWSLTFDKPLTSASLYDKFRRASFVNGLGAEDHKNAWNSFDPTFLGQSLKYECGRTLSVKNKFHTDCDEMNTGEDMINRRWKRTDIRGTNDDVWYCIDVMVELEEMFCGNRRKGVDRWRKQKRAQYDDKRITLTGAAFLFPVQYVGRLIGKGGRHVRSMEKRTGALIHVPETRQRDGTKAFAIIVGTREECRKALHELKDFKMSVQETGTKHQ